MRETVAVQITTSHNDSALDADDADGDFDVGDTHNFLTITAATGTPELDANEDGTAIAPDGTEILGQGLYVGVTVLGAAGRGRFGGTIYVG